MLRPVRCAVITRIFSANEIHKTRRPDTNDLLHAHACGVTRPQGVALAHISVRNERGCERLEPANKTPARLTDAGGRRAGTVMQGHAPGNAWDPMCVHSSRVCAHPRESCRVQPATEDEERVARRLAHAERLSQAPAQAAQARQWGSAPRQQRGLLGHRWNGQNDKRTC